MSDSRRKILHQLADGDAHSGTSLAEGLGITRAAVWKHINALKSEGVVIESDSATGYRIPGGMQLLDTDIIESLLASSFPKAKVVLLDKIDSTNDWLMQQLSTGIHPGTTCLAEQQTAGRGTRGRQWVSPYGKNLYLSFYWQFAGGPLELGGLSLAVAAVTARVLADAGVDDVAIKWPNDLYTAGKKLGGILIDMSAEVNGPSQVVMGIGINVEMPDECRASIDQEVADLRDAGLPKSVDRNHLAALMIGALYECCSDFSATGFTGFLDEWRKRDMVMDREVKLVCGDRIVTGKASGVNSMGALELETEAGFQCFASGDVTLRLS